MIENTTMTVVSEEIVESGYNYLYDNNSFFQGIEKISYDLAKKDGLVTNIASGLGEVTTIGTVSSVTGCPAAGIAGMVAVGKYTQEGWNRFKDTSANWTTSENYDRGIAYGSTNALWEMAQWGTGTGLNKITTVGGSQLKAAALRVGVDTTFNATDTAFRSMVSSRVFNTTYNEEFNARGAWNSVAADVGIGLLGSLGGEIFEYVKSKKTENSDTFGPQQKTNIDNIDSRILEECGDSLVGNNRNEILEGTNEQKYHEIFERKNATFVEVPEQTKKYVERLVGEISKDDILMEKLGSQIRMAKGNFEELDEEARIFIANQTLEYMNERFQKTGNIVSSSGDLHFFHVFNDAVHIAKNIENNTVKILDKKGNIRRGYWQGMFGTQSSFALDKVIELGTSLEQRKGVSTKEGIFLVEKIPKLGGQCSVATNASILGKIAFQAPEKFKKATGINPLIEQDGKLVLNTPELFVESFFNANIFKGGIISEKTMSGGYEINMNSTERGAYGSVFTGFLEGKTNDYLEKHGLPERLKKIKRFEGVHIGETIQKGYTTEEISNIAIQTKKALEEGKIITIELSPVGKNGIDVVLLNDEGGFVGSFDGPHMMLIKDITATGMIADTTWGYYGELSWLEILEKKPAFSIDIMEIEK